MNVYDLMWWGGRYGKIARILSGPFTGWNLTDFRGPSFTWLLEPTPASGFPENGIPVGGIPDDANFPYGFVVEPD